jgi:vitamin K-dependent gamma-carboxylase-like protein
VSWWFTPIPRARIAWLRVLACAFLPFDMLVITRSALSHARVPADLYQPVLLARLVHLPAPTPGTMYTLLAVTLLAALIAALGRLPRAAGFTVALGYLWWVTISMSYGKVDHDHLALVIALFVLPTAGRARIGDSQADQADQADQASGWAVRCIQVAVVAAYFLSSWAKMRIGGPGWPNGATLQWALNRRGTPIGRAFIDYPAVLRISQWVTLIVEFASPLLLLARGRPLYAGVAFFAGFHMVTYALMSIHFLPHAIWLTAFLPLERLGRSRRRKAALPPAEPDHSPASAPASAAGPAVGEHLPGVAQ